MAKNLASYKIGDVIDGSFLVTEITPKVASNKKEYTDITLRDNSAARLCRYWGILSLKAGDIVFAQGVVESYNGLPSYILKTVVLESGNRDDFIASRNYNQSVIDSFVGEIQHKGLKGVCDFVSQFKKDILNAPLGIGSITGCLGAYGESAEWLMKQVSASNLDSLEKELCYVAILIGRSGALDAFELSNGVFKKTLKGELIGLENLSLMKVNRYIVSASKEVSEGKDIFIRLVHDCTASFGNQKPMTVEAIFLRKLAEAEAAVNNAKDVVAQGTDGNWAGFDPEAKVRYYIG